MSAGLRSLAENNLRHTRLASLRSAGRYFWIDRLPNEMIATIVEMLPRVAQSLLIAVQTMQSLVCVSKKMYLTCNDLYITHCFLKACQEAYGSEMAECAAQLKTSGARLFLCRYIHKNRLCETYAVVQKLSLVCCRIFQEAKRTFWEKEGSSGMRLTVDYAHQSITSRTQTATGFVMYIDLASVRIDHPFGSIAIYNPYWYRPHLYTVTLAIAEVLINFLDATFFGFATVSRGRISLDEGPYPDRVHAFALNHSGNSNKIRKIKKAELRRISCQDARDKRGQSIAMISSAWYHYSCYSCRRAFEKVLPKFEMQTWPEKPSTFHLKKVIFYLLKNRKREWDENASTSPA